MKRILLSISLSVLLACSAHASGRVVERTYVSTDKSVYVAGDVVWCSAFCRDLGNNCSSKLSSVVYVELHSPEGMVQGAKIALVDGRGAGSFTLPLTLPTGNYKLVAYTAQNENEENYNFECSVPKIISVFNVFSKERVKNGVEVVDDQEYGRRLSATAPSTSRGVEITAGDKLKIRNLTGKDASVSVSVFHEDGIAGAQSGNVCDFADIIRKPVSVQFVDRKVPDYEGEIIDARIVGFKPELIPQLIGKYAFISAPGNKSDIYSASIQESGEVRFITGNIYSDKELITEIEGIDSTMSVHLELESPFVAKDIAAPAALVMAPSIADALLARGAAMQIEKRFAADTLYEFLPIRDNLLFDSKSIQYKLDDYTRFPTMQEVITEFISQLRVRRSDDGKRDIQVRTEDDYKSFVFAKGASLMMLDGVPVFNHETILNYDPLLVETVNIYPYTYYVGSRLYDGIVNFVTYKKNLPSMKFSNSARVVNYQGVSYPTAYTCRGLERGGDYPDYRQTVYWHPSTELPAGADVEVEYVAPSYKGRFSVVVEGLTGDGEPLYQKITFDIE
ncbi:MAG: hypothetical protein KBS58_00645 [Bacteroidales bacterium]|nr:hypothetical protein [Candidatus Cacconaster equi]